MILNILREHYWILNARKTVRAVLSTCVICLRHAKRNVTTPSVSLPENRIKDAVVFEIIGFDLAGPLYLKEGSKASKIHLKEGKPSVVYCDNGSNFAGASNYLKIVNWDVIAEFSSIRKIKWFFYPPTASWWGDQVDEVVLSKGIKYRQQLITDIRERFRSEYLGLLTQRNENKKQERDIKLGEVALIVSDNVKCNDWPLGVIKLLPVKDGLRPVQRIFLLEIS
ncbi:integrase catalytic domain-containing protein [Trichonephila clavipes]|nr:integrase catalytic domain-containing protein [Trichonephila clavipes]